MLSKILPGQKHSSTSRDETTVGETRKAEIIKRRRAGWLGGPEGFPEVVMANGTQRTRASGFC